MYLWEKVKENLDSFYYSLGPPINRVVRLTCGPHEASAYPSVVTPLSLLLAQSLGHLLPNPRSWCPAPHARARLAICVVTKATSQCAPLHYTCPYCMCFCTGSIAPHSGLRLPPATHALVAAIADVLDISPR
jgi:hypothetical protein